MSNSLLQNFKKELINVSINSKDLDFEHLIKERNTLELFFTHSTDGFFFMMLDEPVEWNEKVDKDKIIDYVFDHQRITKVNSAMLNQYGANESEFLGLTPSHFYVDIDEGKKIWKEFFDNGEKQFVTNEKRIDGTLVWIEGNYKCFYDEYGRITGHFGIQREITERIENQKKLEEQRLLLENQNNAIKHLHLLSENTGDLICLHDMNGKFTYVSQSVKKILGYSTEEFLGHFPNEFIHRDDLHKVNNLVLNNKSNELNLEYRMKTKDGDYLWFATLVKLLRYEDTGLYYIQSNSRDISSWKVYEAVLRREKERALKASQVKDEFLSVISHEIRTPLHGIEGLTHLLLETNPTDEQLKNLQILRHTVENLKHLINDILDYSKIQAGKLVLEETEISVHKLIENIDNSFRFEAEAKGIRLITEVDASIPQVLIGDSIRLMQVINNLVNNAIKFTHNGTVRLSVSLIKSSKPNICELNFEVTDTGIGIPDNMRKKIFTRFTQASSDTTRKYGGTGLGLSITKQLLELLGSEIQVVSRVGVGSKFFFNIELKKMNKTKNNSIPIHSTKTESKFDLQKCHILVVEDNEINRTIIEQYLKKWNANFDFAQNGLVGVEKIKNNHYDIVLMDIQMPVMSGIDATQLIRKSENEKLRNLPIVALTADITIETKKKIDNTGFNSYISKPFNPEELYNLIVNILYGNQVVSHDSDYQLDGSTDNIVDFNKLIEICNFDSNSTAKMIASIKISFDGFVENYSAALESGNYKDLRSAHHQVKPGIAIMNFDRLTLLVEEGKMLLTNNASKADLRLNAEKVRKTCDLLQKYLNKCYEEIFQHKIEN